MSSEAKPILQVEHVNSFYGHIQALHDVSLQVNYGEIVTMIGANGAGKSTLMMTIFGHPRARDGRIIFDGWDITDEPTHHIARRGISLVPEGRRIFPRMTVLENLQLGAELAVDSHFDDDLAFVYSLFPVLEKRQDQRAGTLSGGEQQMLAIGRALMGKPRFLMLDEPSLGLAPLVVKQVFDVLRQLNEEHNMTIFLVEQNAWHALKLAHRGHVLVNGRITMSGSGEELLASDEVRAAYLEGGA